MYKIVRKKQTDIAINNSYEGVSIEKRIQRMVNNKEPITDSSPLVYTERKDGVKPEYDIRTDRFEIAIEAMDTVTKTNRAKREENPKTIGEKAKEGMEKEGVGDGKTEPTQGTNEGGNNT